jgi:hypothetical protein
MSDGNTIAGRKQEPKYDFYETPKWATKSILDALLKSNIINKEDDIYDPCSGAGAITDVLREYEFKNIKCSDIQTLECIDGDKGIDVWNIEDNTSDIIFTNPPYGKMTKENMLQEFLRIARKKVILLLNIYFLSSNERKEMLKNSHLRYVYIHSKRVTMYPYGQEKPKSSGTKMYGWFVFDKEYNGEPVIRWI